MVVYICHEHDLLKKSYDLLEGWEGLAVTASDPITLPTKFLMGVCLKFLLQGCKSRKGTCQTVTILLCYASQLSKRNGQQAAADVTV